MTLFNNYLTVVSVVGFTCAIQPFIILWLGEKYLLSVFIVCSFSIYIYSDSIRNTLRLFKDAAGICKEDKHMYIIAILINIFVSVILCKLIGLSGVILGTAISYIFLYLFSYPKYVYSKLFNQKISTYHLENLKYFIFALVSTFISYTSCIVIKISSPLILFISNCLFFLSI